MANTTWRTPRSRGAVTGLLLIVLGAWGALVAVGGPLFGYGYTPDAAWTMTVGRWTLQVLPGAAVFLAGSSSSAQATGSAASAAACSPRPAAPGSSSGRSSPHCGFPRPTSRARRSARDCWPRSSRSAASPAWGWPSCSWPGSRLAASPSTASGTPRRSTRRASVARDVAGARPTAGVPGPGPTTAGVRQTTVETAPHRAEVGRSAPGDAPAVDRNRARSSQDTGR